MRKWGCCFAVSLGKELIDNGLAEEIEFAIVTVSVCHAGEEGMDLGIKSL